MSSDAITVFFAYSHKDEALRDELAKHLEALKYSGDITSWYDRKILPGDEWEKKIKESLNSAQIILLLISSDFIASRYCRDIEITGAMERHEAGEACVIPVILRDCLWTETPFGKLQALPKDAAPVMDTERWATKDKAFKDIVLGIKKAAGEIRKSLKYHDIAEFDRYKSEDPSASYPHYSIQNSRFTFFLKKTWILQILVIAVWLVASSSLSNINLREFLTILFISGSSAGIISGMIEGVALKILRPASRTEEIYLKYPLIGLCAGVTGWTTIGVVLETKYMNNGNEHWIGLTSGLITVLVSGLGYSRHIKKNH